MIFKQIAEIEAGDKTQTRRIVKKGERLLFHDDYNDWLVMKNNRVKWWTGTNYPMIPKMFQKGVGFVRFTKIHSEHLQSITHDDALAEGVGSVLEYKALWNSINKKKGIRWDDNPRVWVITFEYVGKVKE